MNIFFLYQAGQLYSKKNSIKIADRKWSWNLTQIYRDIYFNIFIGVCKCLLPLGSLSVLERQQPKKK